MQDGPYFAVLDPTARVVKPGVLSGTWSLAYRLDAGKVGNGFDAFPTFSAKYKKIRRPMPKLEGRVYGELIQSRDGEELMFVQSRNCFQPNYINSSILNQMKHPRRRGGENE